MKLTVLAPLVLAAALGVPALAQAGCAEFEAIGSELVGDYDPFSPSTVERLFNLRVARLDPDATSVRFILVDGTSRGGYPGLGAYGPARFDVSWARDASRNVLFWGAEQPGLTNGAVVAFGATGAAGASTEPFRLRIPAGQEATAGRHQQDLEVRYVCSYGDEVGPTDFQTGNRVSIDLTVPEILRTFIGSQGVRRGEIALGTLSHSGGVVSGEVALTAQSTVPYAMAVQSRRNGLRRSDQDAYAIPYEMTLAGRRVSSGDTLICGPTEAPGGRSQMFGVRLDQALSRRVPEGVYSDTVTVTFTPGLGLGGGGCGSA